MPEREGSRPPAVREVLRTWYGPRRRAYPWRRARPDAFATLVSEVMLQQTQAPRVAGAFTAFLDRFPDVASLASAPRADVIRAWEGMGYHGRAVRLHEAARAIVRDHGGRVPDDVAALRSLPGVGPYTASAVASIAFGRPVAAVDTNVRRITARYLRGVEPDELAPAEVATLAQGWLDPERPGDWNQALMDLGREVCRPTPRCPECPLARACRFRASGRAGRSSTVRQSPFEGSLRQIRGRALGILRERGSVREPELLDVLGDPRAAGAVASLVRDGLAERRRGGRVGLPSG
jgi:A/G-specific adenine glycosylase